MAQVFMMSDAISVVVKDPPLSSIKEAGKQERKLRHKIERSLAAGQFKRAKHFTQAYLDSRSAKYIATTKANRELKLNRRVKPDLILEIAATLNPYTGTNEGVTVNAIPKDSNPYDHRVIYSFGIENRALQILVREALCPWAKLHPNQYAIQGGRQEAGEAVLNALGGGFRWTVQTDIRDCFTTFNEEEVTRMLPLPPQVTERVLTARHLNINSGNLIDTFGPVELTAEVRRGLPQGSAASSLVTEILLAPIAFALPADVRSVNYADNFLVLTREKSEAVTMGKTLRGALLSHPAGPLWPNLIEIRDARKGFDFLGYRFSKEADFVRVEPTTFNLNKFNQRHYSGLSRLNESEGTLPDKIRLRRKAKHYVRSWCQSFSLWPDWLEFRTKKLAEIGSTTVLEFPTGPDGQIQQGEDQC